MDINKMVGNAFVNRTFRQVNNVVRDMMTGKLGVQNDESIVTLDETDADADVQGRWWIESNAQFIRS